MRALCGLSGGGGGRERKRRQQLSYWTRIFQDEEEGAGRQAQSDRLEEPEEADGVRAGGKGRRGGRQAVRKWIFSFRRRNSPFRAPVHCRRRRRLIVFMGNENGPLGEGINWKHRW